MNILKLKLFCLLEKYELNSSTSIRVRGNIVEDTITGTTWLRITQRKNFVKLNFISEA
jgi:hypothetical protein